MPLASNVGYLGIGKQSAKGTGVAPTKFVPWIEEAPMSGEIDLYEQREGGYGQDLALALKVKQRHDGTFRLLARPSIAPNLLAWLLGADSVAGIADPYTHTITFADDPPWLSIERQIGSGTNLIERITDARLSRIVVRGTEGEPVILEAFYAGLSAALQTAAATPAYEAGAPYLFFHGTFTLDAVDVSARVRSFTLTIERRYETDLYAAGTVTRADLPVLDRIITLEAEVVYEDPAVYKDVLYGGGTAPSELTAEANFVADFNLGTTPARQLKIEVPRLAYRSAPINLRTPPDLLVQRVELVAVKPSAAQTITVTAQNGDATAY